MSIGEATDASEEKEGRRGRWFSWYDRVYEFLRKTAPGPERLGVCPAGAECAPNGWGCCPGKGEDPGEFEFYALPFEREWLAAHPEEVQRGCAGCARGKLLICALWPVVPFVSQVEYCLTLHLHCDAFMLCPEHYLPAAEVATQAARLLYEDFEDLIQEYCETVGRMALTHEGIAISARLPDVRRMLSDPEFPNLVRTLAGYCMGEMAQRSFRIPALYETVHHRKFLPMFKGSSVPSFSSEESG